MPPVARGGGRRRASIAALVVACLGLTGIAAIAAGDAFVYYRTPTEAVAAGRDTATLRIGGMVVPGSVRETDVESSLLVTDGVTEVEIRYPGRLPDVLREGEGAVVEGRWNPDGSIAAQNLLFRHNNVYEAPELGVP